MNKIAISTALLLFAASMATVQAKDKHKDKDKHSEERSDREYTREHSSNYARETRGYREGDRGERSRTIYIIERERPVERVVYIDSDGRYFQRVDGRRIYVRQRYFESYPSRYYTSSGQRRINITLPF